MIETVFDRLEQLAERLPDEPAVIPPCTGNLLCERHSVRHKEGCYGKPLGLTW